MKEHVPPFLQALELGPDADERAIRRAYAKRLKLIDAEADPAGFQDLRETLERALQWAAWRARDAAEEAASSPVPAHDHADGPGPLDPGSADPTPHEAATTPIATAAPLVRGEPASTPGPDPETAPTLPPGEPAFLDFHAHFQRGIQSPEHATALLEAALADERLVNLEARTFFEWRVAGLLANGWQPGHELLFWPAAVAFGWDTDRRRLALFGPLGAFMDAAIRERLVFFGQEAFEFDRQRLLIQRLRVARVPDRKELLGAMPLLALLLQRFPNWTRAMTPEANVQQWIAAWNALPAHERAPKVPAAVPVAAPQARQAPKRTGGVAMRWAGFVFIIALIRGVAGLAGGATHDEPPTPPAYQPQPAYQPPPAPPVAPRPAWNRIAAGHGDAQGASRLPVQRPTDLLDAARPGRHGARRRPGTDTARAGGLPACRLARAAGDRGAAASPAAVADVRVARAGPLKVRAARQAGGTAHRPDGRPAAASTPRFRRRAPSGPAPDVARGRAAPARPGRPGAAGARGARQAGRTGAVTYVGMCSSMADGEKSTAPTGLLPRNQSCRDSAAIGRAK